MVTDLPAFDALVAEYDMLPPGCKVLCGVSGGADSVCLLHILSRRGDISLAAAHFNHQLRGEESHRDEGFVRTLCREWDIPLTVGCGDVAAEARARKQGIEETARQMRYQFLSETAEKIGASRIATAHNADDNLETLLLHLTRGAGLQGLTGIPPRQGMLVRPLLGTTRKEIEAYLRLYGLPHVEDNTNIDEAYSRNRLRRRVLPILEELNPALRENSAATLRYLRSDNDLLNAQAAELLAQAVRGPHGVSVPADLIAAAPDPLAVRAVRQLLSMTAQGSTDCTAAHLEGLVGLCRGDDPSALLHLPHGLTARRVYETLVITPRPVPPPALEPMALREGETPIPGTAWAAVLEGPPWPGLVVRPRQTGDQLTLPNGHRRSLKKLFIDCKIPRLERQSIPVAADGDGVLAVAGLGPNPAHPRTGQVTFIKITEKEENGQ